ncbi:MAG: FUSC family protein [Acetobacteraceae bacterium]
MPAFLRTSLPRAIRDALFPPDPGALRLRTAFAATLAGVLTFVLLLLAGTVVAVPVADRILGFAIALFIGASLHDRTPRARLITIAFAPFPAFAAVALATLLLGSPLAGAMVVPPIMFAVAAGAARGPRYALFGIVMLIAYFIGLVTRQPPATLPFRLLVLLLAGGSVALVRGVLLPDRPQAELARLRRAVQADIAGILAHIAAAVAAGCWTDPARAALRRDIDRFGEAVMLAQARVAAIAAQLPGQEGVWLHLLEIELATERTARIALEDLGTPADRAPLLTAVEAMQHDRIPPPAGCAAALATALGMLGDVWRDAPGDVQRSAPGDVQRNASGDVRRKAPEAMAPVAAAPPPTAAPWLRPAIQTAIAAAVAIAGGELVSPNRWYWAAFAAFVMFQGTRSRTESVFKGVQFMLGTLAGVVVGTLVAALLSGHEIFTLAVIVGAVFLAFQANQAAYGAMVFWLTIILGLLFGMLGYFTPDLLLLRLQEAAVGAACGALVASLVLVQREHAATRDAIAAFLRALGALVDSAGRRLLGGPPEPDLAVRILATEQRLHELSAIARSEQWGPAAVRTGPLRRRMLLLQACEQWARELGRISLQDVRIADPARAHLVDVTVARIDAILPGLVDRLDTGAAEPRRGNPSSGTWAPAPQVALSDRAVRLLLRIDAALAQLALP